MAAIGKYNTLKIKKLVPFGVYLDGENLGEILMPTRYVPKNASEGDEVDAFIYLDSEDRIIATNEVPVATVDEFAFLKVISVTNAGAFLDWGLTKDLLVPFREQKVNMEVGRWYVVRIYLDTETNRIVGSAKIDKFLDNAMPEYTRGQEVDILICNQTELGYNAIVNNLHWGIVYKNEIFKPIRTGLKTKGYIKKVRDDDKIDLSLDRIGHEKLDDLAQQLLNALNEANGYLPLCDKTEPEVIYKELGLSKKNFKKAVGTLFKMRVISIEEKGIRKLDN